MSVDRKFLDLFWVISGEKQNEADLAIGQLCDELNSKTAEVCTMFLQSIYPFISIDPQELLCLHPRKTYKGTEIVCSASESRIFKMLVAVFDQVSVGNHQRTIGPTFE